MDVASTLASVYLTLAAPIRRRGFRTFMSLVRWLLPDASESMRAIDIDNNVRFAYPSGDAYWQYYFLTGKAYEREVAHAFSLAEERLVLFLDCGANFGYWSVLFSKSVKTVAIEASSESYAVLELNNQLNGGAFTPVHAAITDVSDAHVWFATKPVHAGRNITSEENENKERVATVTIDDLVQNHQQGNGAVFVKLDVEGAEIQALEGAKETLKKDSIFAYEDHAKDRDCLPTAYLLKKRKRIYYIDAAGSITPIRSVEDALKIKIKTKGVGYNFVALGDAAPDL